MPKNRTDNGVTIVPGLRVFVNDWSWGTVVAPTDEYLPADERDGWWLVKIDDDAQYCAGYTKSYNGDRMTTRAPAGAPNDPTITREQALATLRNSLGG